MKQEQEYRNPNHGGVALQPGRNARTEEEEELRLYQRLIAQYAAAFVKEGDSLFLNSCGNALGMLEYIKKPNVTVVTNNPNAVQAAHPEGVSILLTGGELLHAGKILAGEFAMRNLQTFLAKKTFLGCSGISMSSGMTTETAGEVEMNERMIENTREEIFVLADHTKIGHGSGFMSLPVQRLGHLITDEKASEKLLDELRNAGMQIHLVHKGD